MELKISDDAKIQDLAIVMDSQDNPDRIFQFYNFGKSPP